MNINWFSHIKISMLCTSWWNICNVKLKFSFQDLHRTIYLFEFEITYIFPTPHGMHNISSGQLGCYQGKENRQWKFWEPQSGK